MEDDREENFRLIRDALFFGGKLFPSSPAWSAPHSSLRYFREYTHRWPCDIRVLWVSVEVPRQHERDAAGGSLIDMAKNGGIVGGRETAAGAIGEGEREDDAEWTNGEPNEKGAPIVCRPVFCMLRGFRAFIPPQSFRVILSSSLLNASVWLLTSRLSSRADDPLGESVLGRGLE